MSLCCSATLCAGLAGEELGPSPKPESLRIVCDGITTATLAGQDLLYSGRSEFVWGVLQIRVDGQLHVFCGASLHRTGQVTRAQAEIQSITANGIITVSWNNGSGNDQVRGTRLVIRPGSGLAAGGSVTLDGRTDANGTALAGVFTWQSANHRWVEHPPPPKPGG